MDSLEFKTTICVLSQVTMELVVVVGAAVEVVVVVETTMTLAITTASRPPATAQ